MTQVLLGFFLALSFVMPAGSTASDSYDTCTRVVDGDTIELETIGTVRLIGVDTPEAVYPESAPGHAAAEYLRKLIEGERVRLEYDAQRRDKYGRTLAYVYLADNTFVNAAIVRLGYSPAYTRFPFRYRERFIALEGEAREGHRGLWSGVIQEGLGSGIVPGKPEPVTVYVTRTGAKYHREGCRYLARSMIPMSLEEAARAHTPCSVCAPPVPTPQAAPQGLRTTPRFDRSTVSRCQGITKRGTQCKRNAKPGSLYCWQHGG